MPSADWAGTFDKADDLPLGSVLFSPYITLIIDSAGNILSQN
jgi:hypothetical protein